MDNSAGVTFLILFSLLMFALGFIRMFEFAENGSWGGCGGAIVLTIITGGLAPIFFGLLFVFELATGARKRN